MASRHKSKGQGQQLTQVTLHRNKVNMIQENWPDPRSQISKFWDIHFIETVTCINRWQFQGNDSVGVALTSIQTFYEVS